jgi:hypothetical protein
LLPQVQRSPARTGPICGYLSEKIEEILIESVLHFNRQHIAFNIQEPDTTFLSSNQLQGVMERLLKFVS